MQRRQHDNEPRWRLANLLMLVEELRRTAAEKRKRKDVEEVL